MWAWIRVDVTMGVAVVEDFDVGVAVGVAVKLGG
jgi:hypothetical protein